MLEEHAPLNLDYQEVNDICWIDSENIVISSFQVAGGIGLFSSPTGDLRHRYQHNETYELRGFAAGALCFNSDGKIFASCSGPGNGGIGVWDQVTSKQIDFFETSDVLQLGDADKIEWLNGSNCLFISKLDSLYSWHKDHISLLDFRDKSVACSRTSSYSISVVDKHENFGFVDLRTTSESLLTFHRGQLFCSMEDKISVYSGGLDQWVLTSSLERSPGGLIRDFSIGGDRLFALQGEENVFDLQDNVRLNVGGKIFETTATTLASASRNSMFGMETFQPREANEEYFIDRNQDCFSVLLDLLRTGELHVPPHVPEIFFYRDALYYGLLDNVSVRKNGHPPRGWSAIRASPDGGCAVAHGKIVRVYNWMLEEHALLNLDYQRVNDIGWIDTENIVINSFQVDGGVGLFSSSTGNLKQRYKLNHEKDQVKGFAAGALCSNSDDKIFVSCSGTSNGGIGVWDQVTGKQIDFFNSSGETPLGDANKIQWLNGSKCLFVSRLSSKTPDKNHISLLDFRDKSIVTSRSMEHATGTRKSDVVDATPMDQSYSICVVEEHEKFGFVDLRDTGIAIRWSPECEGSWGGNNNNHPKLTFHKGQLFCSMNDKISVYYGALDNWIMTSSLERSQGGSIRDFSIGGDRLFALHSRENEFDVWETPSAPII
ncbi:hypothetical protein MKX03_002425 [Papaver bracteatum]|nr:hypothetical protein MKX03_002425 [Papaver bracteatum]